MVVVVVVVDVVVVVVVVVVGIVVSVVTVVVVAVVVVVSQPLWKPLTKKSGQQSWFARQLLLHEQLHWLVPPHWSANMQVRARREVEQP